MNGNHMKPMPAPNTLEQLAKRYVWWKTPEEALRRPDRLVAQVMNIGDYDDVEMLIAQLGPGYLREVLANAEIGQFDSRSWHYWHYRLGLADSPEDMPPLPDRKLA